MRLQVTAATAERLVDVGLRLRHDRGGFGVTLGTQRSGEGVEAGIGANPSFLDELPEVADRAVVE